MTGRADAGAEALHERFSRARSESTPLTVAGPGHDDPRCDNSFIRVATAAFDLAGKVYAAGLDGSSRREILVLRGNLTCIARAVLPTGTKV
ncbi:hypothetical protein ACFVYV_37795 [Streptomyces mirabilis]|uniref:hypothetical protein n=1 Tax=Streptomyces mirabilis TaxID=68239 RepID=UPI0036DCCAA9